MRKQGTVAPADCFRAYWAVYASLQVYFAARARVDYYDAFENLRNARRLAGAVVGFTAYRPPLVPLLHAPLQRLLDLAAAGTAARVVVPHLFEAAVGGLFLLAFYAHARAFFPPLWAQAGTVMLSLNRMVIHYFSSVMNDIPSALCLLLFLHLVARKKTARWSWLALAAGVASRWNMLIAPVLLALWPPPVGGARGRRREMAVTGAWALLGFAAVALGVFHYGSGLAWAPSARLAVDTIWSQYRAQQGYESAWAYVSALWVSAGACVCACFLVGIVRAAARGESELSFHAAFFLLFFGVMAFGIGHKESRYLFPALPSFYIVALGGFRFVGERWRGSLARPIFNVVLALAIAATGAGAIVEAARFGDPAYRDRVLLDVADFVENNIGPGAKIYWAGAAYSVVPRERVFTRSDAYYYLYHIPSPVSVAYMTGRLIYRPQPPIEEGSLLIEAPEMPFLLDRPLSADQNVIRVSAYRGGRWTSLARWP